MSPSRAAPRTLVRLGRHAVLLERRALVVGAVLATCALLIGLFSLTVGTVSIPAREVWSVLVGAEGSSRYERIVTQIRLPRVLCGLLSGMALGAAGAVLQSVSRNPLGSPDVIGFTTGAATGALVQIVVVDGGQSAIALSALCGGVLTALLATLLSRVDGHSGGYRLILTGIGIGATLAAVNRLLLVMGDLDRSASAYDWLAGSLNARAWVHVWPVLIGVLLLLPLLSLAARPLTMLELGDDLAQELGVGVNRVRTLSVLGAIVLASVATAAVGPIAFVALAAPQIVRRMTHTASVPILTGALLGAVILAGTDLLTQLLPITTVVPVGRLTGVIGGIYLIWLLAQEPRTRTTP